MSTTSIVLFIIAGMLASFLLGSFVRTRSLDKAAKTEIHEKLTDLIVYETLAMNDEKLKKEHSKMKKFMYGVTGNEEANR